MTLRFTASRYWARVIASDWTRTLLSLYALSRFPTTAFVWMDMLPNSREKKVQKNIPHSKQMRRYPGVLIGRLGINVDFAHRGIGSELMEFIKSWFLDAGNKTGCRFLIVDAYNEEIPLGYYQKNGFAFLFSSESQEAENTGFDKSTKLRTRLMYFDLISLVSEEE